MKTFKTRSHCYVVVVLFLLILPFFAAAQRDVSYFQNFTLEDGLSSTDVVVFFQDSRGVIWLGTSYGLNMYDGATIKSYTKEDNGLCHNYIHHIAEDGKGNLWIKGGDFGARDYQFCIFDPIADRFYSIEEYTGAPCPFDPDQTAMFSNYKGTFLFTEQKADTLQFYEVAQDTIEKGFTIFNTDSLLVVNTGFKAYKLDDETYAVAMTLKKGVDIGIMNKIYHLKRSGLIVDDFPGSIPNESRAFGELLLMSDNRLCYEINEGTGKITQKTFYIDGKYVGSIEQDNDKSFALFEQNKAYLFYKDQVKIFQPTPDSLVEKQTFIFEEEKTISKARLFFDRSGNLWHRGVNELSKLSFQPQNFKRYLTGTHKNIPIPVRGIDNSADGDLYVGDSFRFHKKSPDNEGLETIFNNKYGAGILGILSDQDKIWLATEFLGLAKYDLKNKELTYYGKGLVWQSYKAPDGSIWVGAGEGLFKLDSLTKELVPFQNYGAYGELKKSSVYAFHFNQNGTWLSTSSGMYLVDLKEEKVLAHYSETQPEPAYIPANQIAHIHEDKEGIFWLASKGQGLVRWDPITGESEQLTKGNTGLSHNVLYAVYEDDFGNLWLPSNYGLNCLNKTSRQVSLYLKDDGLPHHEFNTTSHHQDQDGNLYFGTVAGMVEFHPRDFNQEEEDSPLILTGVNRINRQTDELVNLTQSVLDEHSLIIPSTDKAADFNFALLNYKKPKENQYSYKIEGFRDEWTFQKAASLRISGLPYGDYQLLIRGKASGSNRWIAYPHPIKIKVEKPFYLQWWFTLSSFLTILGIVFLVIKRNTQKLLARQQELEIIVEERTEEIRMQAAALKELDKVKSNFFANISHELRTPLTLILGPLSYIIENAEVWEKENIQRQLLVMKRNGKCLMHLIEEILDLSKLEANKLELQEEGTPVIPFFEQLFLAFEPQVQNLGLEYEMTFNINKNLSVLMDRKKMEKVLNNFLSNAIKFTSRNGKIILSVTESARHLCIEIADSGKGIHPADLPHIFERFYQSKQVDHNLYGGGTGIGLALVNEYAQLMGGKAYAKSTLGVGSNFYFEFPKKEVTQSKILPQTEMIDLSKEDEIYSIGSDFTILVVEDNHDMQTFIHQLLRKEYKNILLANNGAEGLQTLKTYGTGIDLIISDVMMPEVDGLTMLKKIKRHPEWYGIPVVMLTALAAERDKLTALTIGVDDYLTKPFSVPELLIRVQNLLFNYAQRQEWKGSTEFQEELIADETAARMRIDEQDNEEVKVAVKTDVQININAKDKEWLEGLKSLVAEKMGDAVPDVESLAAGAFMSSRQLNRRLKAISGFSASKFIREVQLQAARKILENGTAISISEVAYEVGFQQLSTFSRLFKGRFGKKPSEYLN